MPASEEKAAATELHALAQAVGRLRPDWREAERFYELRSEIVAALRRLSRRLALEPEPRRLLVSRACPVMPMPIAVPAPVPRRALPIPRPAPMPAPLPAMPLRVAPPPVLRSRQPRVRRHRYPCPPASQPALL